MGDTNAQAVSGARDVTSRSEWVGKVLSTGGVQALLSLAERARWPAARLAALTYHRVDHDDDPRRAPSLLSATPEEFAAQIELLDRRFHLVGIDEVLGAITDERPLPDHAVLLTFDDAGDDFATHALPVLERVGAPAVVFVPTGFVDRPDAVFWWDAVHASLTTTGRREPYDSPAGRVSLATDDDRVAAARAVLDHLKQVPFETVVPAAMAMCRDLEVDPPTANVMGWETLRSVARRGVAVCPHSRHHPHLDRLPLAEARSEVVGSMEDLRRELGASPPVFAYPAGQMSAEVIDVVAGAGFDAAFTTRRGLNRIGDCDPLTLRRINVSRRTGLGAVRVQMQPSVDRLRRWRGSGV